MWLAPVGVELKGNQPFRLVFKLEDAGMRAGMQKAKKEAADKAKREADDATTKAKEDGHRDAEGGGAQDPARPSRRSGDGWKPR